MAELGWPKSRFDPELKNDLWLPFSEVYLHIVEMHTKGDVQNDATPHWITTVRNIRQTHVTVMP
jgi:hypothetical protein